MHADEPESIYVSNEYVNIYNMYNKYDLEK